MKKSKQFWSFIASSLIVYTVVQVLINVGMLNNFYSNTFIFMAINIMLGGQFAFSNWYYRTIFTWSCRIFSSWCLYFGNRDDETTSAISSCDY